MLSAIMKVPSPHHTKCLNPKPKIRQLTDLLNYLANYFPTVSLSLNMKKITQFPLISHNVCINLLMPPAGICTREQSLVYPATHMVKEETVTVA